MKKNILLIATGGTIEAIIKMVEELGGEVGKICPADSGKRNFILYSGCFPVLQSGRHTIVQY